MLSTLSPLKSALPLSQNHFLAFANSYNRQFVSLALFNGTFRPQRFQHFEHRPDQSPHFHHHSQTGVFGLKLTARLCNNQKNGECKDKSEKTKENEEFEELQKCIREECEKLSGSNFPDITHREKGP